MTKLALFIKSHNNEEMVLATRNISLQDEKSIETAKQELTVEQNNWIQNGGTEFVTAQYRIGNYNRFGI